MDDTRIQVGDFVVPLAALRADPQRFGTRLARARSEHGNAWCLCCEQPLKLVIRRSSTGRYHVAGWPGDGTLHASKCAFHKLDASLTGRSGYTATAIAETDDGTSIRLAAALRQRVDRALVRPKEKLAGQPAAASRRAVGLLGMLHFLWEQAHLTRWSPGETRDWTECHHRLRREIAECRTQDGKLGDLLYLVPPFRHDAAERNAARFQLFTQRLGRRAEGTIRRGLVLGEIRQLEATTYGQRIGIAHLRGHLYISDQLAARAAHSYRAAFASTAAAGRRVGLFVVEPSKSGTYLNVCDLAIMLTSKAYLPVDSSHEITMADALTAARRLFVKPLRYDSADAVLPDFVLLDTVPPTYVEVYGVRGREAYDARKKIKQRHYRDAGVPVVEWDTTASMPDVRLVRTL